MHAPNDIYACLMEGEKAGDFHWALCLTEAYKMHATNDNGASDWRYECVRWSGFDTDVRGISYSKIGQLDLDFDVRFIEEYVKDMPMSVPPIDRSREPRFTSRVWFREAVRVLHGAGMFVRCDQVDRLEHELAMRATADQYRRRDLPIFHDHANSAGPWFC
ncbi:hypothetical protein FISHEDRAFT_40143 [Fistulina hepatica ATCC 64428]|uniref:Uncharacterized protein n=1 Tax=Fistulina hepatica ATCC 64428 TaxID=1128425 RepID=A0A0D7AGN4_9AGAR|nr:hypothetical protein FISHEDRAFT_40143 [Fistulina hepatica ATCC 64428]